MSAAFESWTSAVLHSIRELGESALMWEDWGEDEVLAIDPPHEPGAFISLVSPDDAVQIGFSCTRDGCEKIARALLCLEDTDEVTDSTLADAMAEVANIVAGGVKRAMNETDHRLQLGLPIFVDGFVEASHHLESRVAAVRLGSVEGHAIVMRERKRHAAA